MKSSQNQMLWGVLVVGATLYLMSSPRCNRGCKTLLAHLLTHELEGLL